MASNVSAGTRGLSAGDWIRLKRLQGAREFQNDKDGDVTNSTLRLEAKSGRHVYTDFGTSKIRRPASSWTDYRAARSADYVLETQNSDTKSRSLTVNYVCCRISGYRVTSKTFTVSDQSPGNTFDLISGIGLSVNDPIVFSTIVTCSSVISGKVYYVKTKPSVDSITISETIGGPEVDISACDMATDRPTITLVTLTYASSSAIKHNGLCVKCST